MMDELVITSRKYNEACLVVLLNAYQNLSSIYIVFVLLYLSYV